MSPYSGISGHFRQLRQRASSQPAVTPHAAPAAPRCREVLRALTRSRRVAARQPATESSAMTLEGRRGIENRSAIPLAAGRCASLAIQTPLVGASPVCAAQIVKVQRLFNATSNCAALGPYPACEPGTRAGFVKASTSANQDIAVLNASIVSASEDEAAASATDSLTLSAIRQSRMSEINPGPRFSKATRRLAVTTPIQVGGGRSSGIDVSICVNRGVLQRNAANQNAPDKVLTNDLIGPDGQRKAVDVADGFDGHDCSPFSGSSNLLTADSRVFAATVNTDDFRPSFRERTALTA